MVYAYGSSAGGTLAALLAGDGLIGAAVAEGAGLQPGRAGNGRSVRYGPKYWERSARLAPARYRLSPSAPPGQGIAAFATVIRADRTRVVPIGHERDADADKFRKVHLVGGPGGTPPASAPNSSPPQRVTLIWLARSRREAQAHRCTIAQAGMRPNHLPISMDQVKKTDD